MLLHLKIYEVSRRWVSTLSNGSYVNYLQMVFIICVCNQLLVWMENELVWVLSFIPGFKSVLPNLIAKLHSVTDKYLATKPHVPSNIEVKKWDFFVWIMLMRFFVKIVNSTAQQFLKKQQDKEIAALKNTLGEHADDSYTSPR